MKSGFTDRTVEFSQLVLGFSSAALHYLGEDSGDTPRSAASETNMALARQNIEIIRMLKVKTSGNLSQDEMKLIDQVLTDLMLKFHEASRTATP